MTSSWEPDEFHRGIAPSVKLLHAAVSRLVDVRLSDAVNFVGRWKLINSPVHLRLWAALSRDSRVTPADDVGTLLLSLDNRRFWYLHDYPEIAELRAKRFNELGSDQQSALTARIRKCPPRNQWPTKIDADRVKNARIYWAVRELRRIEIAGASLPANDKAWLDARIKKFPDLLQMDRLDEGFASLPKARFIRPNPDNQYDLLVGEERLKALKAALSTTRGGWEDDPSRRASDWIRQPGNAVQMIADFESISDGGAAYAKIWEQFGWTHAPVAEQINNAAKRNLPRECGRVLRLLAKLPAAPLREAVDGISHWLSTWEKQVVVRPTGVGVWLKVWPIAVEVTNTEKSVEENIDLSSVVRASKDREPQDLDTLNTPAGKLVGVFLASCPNLHRNKRPFNVNATPRKMRDLIIAATGRAGLIARHRMIEWLPYFLRADPSWTQEYLIKPLVADNVEAVPLWRAIARQTRFFDVLEIIGAAMVERTTDLRLGRDTRRSLVFSLIIECLYAYLEKRDPAVPYAQIQQMIRSLDDEVRAYAAEAIQRFVHDVSTPAPNVPYRRGV